jgi:hypothetical protein
MYASDLTAMGVFEAVSGETLADDTSGGASAEAGLLRGGKRQHRLGVRARLEQINLMWLIFCAKPQNPSPSQAKVYWASIY